MSDSCVLAGIIWTHLDSLGVMWTHEDLLGLTWIHLNLLEPLGPIWIQLNPLEITEGKREGHRGERKMESAQSTFQMHLHLA